MTNNFNYITQQISKNGTDWIAALRPEDIQRQAKRIVRDIVRGSIKYEEVGMYFLDMKFLENLIIGIKNELDINIMNYNACCFQYQYYPMIPNLGNHITALSNAITVYQTVMNKLNIVKSSGNIGSLVDIPGLLFKYKNYIN